VLDSRHWKSAEAVAQMPFQLDGDAIPTSRSTSRRTWISTGEGVVLDVVGNALRLGESRTLLRHSVPSSFDLGGLLGRRVRVTLVHVASLDAGLAQTLTIAGTEGEPLVIAHAGDVRGLMHVLAGLTVYVALSQRPRGPMVFGTSRLQTIVREGDHVRVRDGDEAFVLHFESRSGNAAMYAIGREDLWRGPPSTMR
jgi:hypothetical protein